MEKKLLPCELLTLYTLHSRRSRITSRFSRHQTRSVLFSRTIIDCWNSNPKSRPDFGKIAKQLESDIIMWQVSLPAVFIPANSMAKDNPINQLVAQEIPPSDSKAEAEAFTKVQTISRAPTLVKEFQIVSDRAEKEPVKQKSQSIQKPSFYCWQVV
jgi:hypothetical protein